jgi:hypothetical protein
MLSVLSLLSVLLHADVVANPFVLLLCEIELLLIQVDLLLDDIELLLDEIGLLIQVELINQLYFSYAAVSVLLLLIQMV